MILKILLRILYSKLFFFIIFPWVFQHEVGWILVPMSIPLLNSRFCISFQHQSNKYDSVHLWFSFNNGSTTHLDFYETFSSTYKPYQWYHMFHIIKYMGHIIYSIWYLYVNTLPSITSFKSDSQKYSFLSQLKKSARSCVGQFVYVSKTYFIHVSFLHEPSSDTSLPFESQKDLSTWFEIMV